MNKFVPFAVIGLLLAAAYAFGLHEEISLSALADRRDALATFVAERPITAILVYFTIYAAAVAIAFPASVLTIFGGFLFGWFAGGLLAALAATIGAAALFLAARTALRDVLSRKAGSRIGRLKDGFHREAFAYLLALRLAPVLPFFLVNIAPALFDVRVSTFLAATLIGILPGTFAYAYLGQGIDSVLVAAAARDSDITLTDIVTFEITLAFALLAGIALLTIAGRRWWRRKAP